MFKWRQLPEIPNDAYPEQLHSAQFGDLDLKMNFLIRRGDDLAYVDLDRLMPGNEVLSRYVRYEASSQPKMNLHPPQKGHVDEAEWVRAFEERAAFLKQRWKDILSSRAKRLIKLFKSYGEDHVEVEDYLSRLVITHINVSMGSCDGLVFDPAPPFESFNLNASVTQKGVLKQVSFDG